MLTNHGHPVSIDGAFFADGTFVGPDTSNFFNQTKAGYTRQNDESHSIEWPSLNCRFTKLFGGADGTRTRDLRRDRPAF